MPRVYCGPCIAKLCGATELQNVKDSKEWICYMCAPNCGHVGLLERRENWDRKLHELFLNDHETEYVSLGGGGGRT